MERSAGFGTVAVRTSPIAGAWRGRLKDGRLDSEQLPATQGPGEDGEVTHERAPDEIPVVKDAQGLRQRNFGETQGSSDRVWQLNLGGAGGAQQVA
ncbi:hypothetical protein GCM10008956_38370 [Deinococcus arenae]|uniref:Uncharacterized protein n=1 Tax=Deinococcus arenae TaxID=1452751 RepID=A0A8H9GSF3_9DEIO|nr:hypothetical protein GCM10008956_38370 [Deinococcus arenae]